MSVIYILNWLRRFGTPDEHGQVFTEFDVSHSTTLNATMRDMSSTQSGLFYLWLSTRHVVNDEMRYQPCFQFDILDGEITQTVYRHYAVEPSQVTCPGYYEEFADMMWQERFTKLFCHSRRSDEVTEKLFQLSDSHRCEMPDDLGPEEYEAASLEVEEAMVWLKEHGKKHGHGRLSALKKSQEGTGPYCYLFREDANDLNTKYLHIGEYFIRRHQLRFNFLSTFKFTGELLVAVASHAFNHSPWDDIKILSDEEAVDVCKKYPLGHLSSNVLVTA